MKVQITARHGDHVVDITVQSASVLTHTRMIPLEHTPAEEKLKLKLQDAVQAYLRALGWV